MDWIAVGTLGASVIGAVGALGAGVIAWLVYRQQKYADYPAISVEITPEDTPNWYLVEIKVLNQSTVHWKADKASLLAPSGAKLVNFFDATRVNDGAGNDIVRLDLTETAKLTSDAATYLTVAPAGTKGNQLWLGSSDRHSETLFLFMPPSSSMQVKLRFRICSTEAKQRRKTIDISRTLIAHPAKATA
ncbi:hypothetical protein [Mesorhizobium sp. Pch-S]|uniref:hypothetical protein n=1 Tax=Mesorhizobium sp. Pch-S TaxID=2082387 RepID=UPI001010C254|nr:hypothetical protein [Mesorhizobium sp. Pch-S]QAZ45923.1 hypothetical protein C1M53_26420 [Mesorhizobium sp. Pch-S]